MNIDIRFPNITGDTDAEQLRQIRSYLYQLAPQLNWALNTLETASSASQIVMQKPKASSISEESEKKVDNFNEIKALVIKSAEIVEAFYEKIATTLASEYKAVSEGIGSYEQTSTQDIIASSEGVRQMFANMQKLEGDFNGLFKDNGDSVLMIKTDAYIKTGVLYTNDSGTPIYGIEVGQVSTNEDGETLYNGVARFMPDKLSFFGTSGSREDGDEVAYISGEQFYITRGEIVESLRIGGYLLTTSRDTGLAFKWIGYSQ